MIVGGNGYFGTEGCRYIRGEMKCVKQKPNLDRWKFYPALMPVTENYCK